MLRSISFFSILSPDNYICHKSVPAKGFVTDGWNVLYTQRDVLYEISISLSRSFHQPKQKSEKYVVKWSANININRQYLKEEMWLCLTDL